MDFLEDYSFFGNASFKIVRGANNDFYLFGFCQKHESIAENQIADENSGM